MVEFNLQSTMKDVEKNLPFARALLHAKFHVGGCATCGYEPDETISEVAHKHSKSAAEMLIALNNGLSDMQTAEIEPVAASKLIAEPDVLIVDVREAWEHELCKLNEKSILLTEKTMPLIFEKAAAARAVILYCHHGMRSFNAALYMRQNGIQNALSLRGGIDRFAQIVDPSIPRY